MARNNGAKPLADLQVARLARDSASQVWQLSRSAYSHVGSAPGRLVGGLLSIAGRIDRGAQGRVVEARASATDLWDRLEGAFVYRVAQVLNALQIPTARDVHELNSRVASLQKAVVALERRAAQALPANESGTARGKAAARKRPATRSVKDATPRTRTKAGN